MQGTSTLLARTLRTAYMPAPGGRSRYSGKDFFRHLCTVLPEKHLSYVAKDQSRRASFVAPTERSLENLPLLLVEQGLYPGDVYCLYGAVGAGKSVFSRAFVRAAAGDPFLTVPSPTYLLQNIYDEETLANANAAVHHFDLYRLPPSSPSLQRLNLGSSFQSAVSLVEWAERLGDEMPAERLAIRISILHDQQEQHHAAQQSLLIPSVLPSAQGVACEAGELEGEDEDEDEDMGVSDEDIYSDRRWRLVEIESHGSRWAERLRALQQAVEPKINLQS